MKRFIVLLLLVGVSVAGSRSALKLSTTNDPTTAREQLWYNVPRQFNAACDDLDSVFSYTTGLSATAIDKADITADSVYVGNALVIGGGSAIDSIGVSGTDSLYISIGGNVFWFTPTSVETPE